MVIIKFKLAQTDFGNFRLKQKLKYLKINTQKKKIFRILK